MKIVTVSAMVNHHLFVHGCSTDSCLAGFEPALRSKETICPFEALGRGKREQLGDMNLGEGLLQSHFHGGMSVFT